MKKKIETLYKNRHQFSSYMIVLILKWHELFQNKNFKPAMMGHNSVLFVNRAIEKINHDKHHI